MRSLLLRSAVTPAVAATAFSALVALFGWGEYSNWKSQISAAEQSLEQTAEAITQHADDLIEMCRLPLASLIVEIRDNRANLDLNDKVNELILRQLKASPTIRTLSYIGPDGRLVATSADQSVIGADYSDRDYFKYHRQSPFPLAVLGKPVESRLSHEWVLPISQRVVFDDGSFGGVVVSTIPVNHFVNFFRNFRLGTQASFLLVRGDGMILARGPTADGLLGSDMSSQPLFTEELKTRTSGAHRYHSRFDGIDRIGGFYQSSRTGIVGLAAESERQTFLKWADAAKVRWAYAGVLMILAMLAYLYWRRQAGLREANARLLAARETEFRLLAESSSDMISRFDENGIREYVSPSCRTILGVEPEQLIGRSVYANMPAETLALVKAAAERMLSGSGQEKLVTPHIRPDGEEVWLETALSALPSTPGGGTTTRVVAVTRDVTRHKREQDALDLLANSDELTKLANRRLFNSRLEQMLATAGQSGASLSLLMIDADRFKLYNDTYGHAAGDECLRQIAAVLRRCVRRPGDIAARYGGEELAVLLAATDARGAEDVAEAIRSGVEALAIPHEKNLPFGCVTVSIGTATFSTEPARNPANPAIAVIGEGSAEEALQTTATPSGETLFSDADAALYKAKTRGRNRVVTGGPPAVLLRSVQ